MADETNETKEAPGGTADAGGEKQATVEDLITQLEQEKHKLEQEKKDLHDRLLRTAADFENWKKRAKKELDEGASKGREGLIKELLPVIDNLERAIKHAPGDDPLAQGVRMVEKQLVSAMEKFGITRFSAEGQPFDPTMHDAIQQVETTEVPAGNVALQYAAGYLQNGRLLRPAMVGVAKAPEAAQESAQPKENG
jgi:molecular chaperone GrpE